MLPKNQRIPRKMFPLLSKGAKVFQNGLFSLKFIQQSGSNSRFCFSVSKKVAKNAVARNKSRRAGYRELQKYIPDMKSNILAIFYFKRIPKDSEDVSKNIESILKESKLLK
jgi:ribonuclease P protein component